MNLNHFFKFVFVKTLAGECYSFKTAMRWAGTFRVISLRAPSQITLHPSPTIKYESNKIPGLTMVKIITHWNNIKCTFNTLNCI